jgi:hypothetical protein
MVVELLIDQHSRDMKLSQAEKFRRQLDYTIAWKGGVCQCRATVYFVTLFNLWGYRSFNKLRSRIKFARE